MNTSPYPVTFHSFIETMSRHCSLVFVLLLAIFIRHFQCYNNHHKYGGWSDWNKYQNYPNHPGRDDSLQLDQCSRPCTKNQPSRVCYYQFNLEFYPAMGAACDRCSPNITQSLKNDPSCECILADGVERTVYSVNRMLPGPQIQVCKNDYIVVDVENMVEGVDASLHWHGLFQEDYQYYDGVPYVTQCPIDSTGTFRYQFPAAQPGTYFWHSHVSVHRLDGQYGALVIRDPPEDDPHSSLYDEDDPAHVLVISDWMHQLATERFPGLRVRLSGQTPQNFLINGVGKFTFSNGNITNVNYASFNVKPGRRHRFRLINALTSVCTIEFKIESHRLLLIAQDGANNVPVYVDTLMTAAGERADFIIDANMTSKPYWIQVRGLGECADPGVQQLAILQYQGNGEQAEASAAPTYKASYPQGIVYDSLNGTCDPVKAGVICPSNLQTVERFSRRILQVDPDIRLSLPFSFHNYAEEDKVSDFFSANKSRYPEFFATFDRRLLASTIDDVIFETATAPPISEQEGYKKFCYGPDSPYCKQQSEPGPCKCTHLRHIPLDSLVEVLIYDQTKLDLSHPFHLHGTNFHVFDVGHFDDDRNITAGDMQLVMKRHVQRLRDNMYQRPSQKDTVLVPRGGWVIFRYIASNPGFWLFHCHLDWHSVTGMQMIFHVGDMSDLPPIPPKFPTCGSFKPPVSIPWNKS